MEKQTKSKKKRKSGSHRTLQLVGGDAGFRFTEAYKTLRTNLEFLASTRNCKKILITSSIPGEGKTNVTVNLAATLAAGGKRVVIVDCDLRKSSVSRYLGISRSRGGLTSVFTKKAALNEVVTGVRINEAGVAVLPCGAIPPNPTELLMSTQMADILAKLDATFDYIIIDSPPVSVVTDAAVLSPLVDGVLLVVRSGLVTSQEVQLSKKNLNAVNAHILGVVLNGYDVKNSSKRDAYYYTYAYDYHHDDKEGSYNATGDTPADRQIGNLG